MTEYTFGDSDAAADRLLILDRVFASTTDALLASVHTTPTRVADLGCGPGATTARLLQRFPAAVVTGLDASPDFVAHARASVSEARFDVGDVTRPLPGAPFDLVYARFLLAHLEDVPGALRVWARALTLDGLLVLEETEYIESDDPDFAQYETLVRTRVASRGAKLYAGPHVVASLPPTIEVVVDRVQTLDVTAGDAAAMFSRNLATWGNEAVAEGLVTEPERVTLLAHLQEREADTTRGMFTWIHHQVIARLNP